MSINKWMDKDNVVYTHTHTIEYYSSLSDCFCPDNHVIVSFLFLQIWIGFRDFRFHRFQSAFALHTQVSGGGRKVINYTFCLATLFVSVRLETMLFLVLYFIAVQSHSHVWLFATPWIAAHQASLPFTIFQSLLKLLSSESMMPSNYLVSVIPFFSWLLSFSAAGSFPISQLFTSGGQSIEASVSASVLLMNIHKDWFPLGLTGLISLQSKELSRVFNTTVQKHQFFDISLLYGLSLTSIHDYWKNHSFEPSGHLLAK